MATGSILLPISGATPSDGSTNDAFPEVIRLSSSATAPSPHFVEARFDSATDEHIQWTFRMPQDYASAPVAKLLWYTAATSGNAVWGCRVSAVTPATESTIAQAFDTANTTTTAAGGTANYLVETSITLTNADSLAANDMVVVQLYRDADNASDTINSNDCMAVAFSIEYTTT